MITVCGVYIVMLKCRTDTFTDRIAHRTHGRSKSTAEDCPTVSAHLLASRPQGAYFYQLTGRTHEHGREVEAEDRLWARRGRVAVSVNRVIKNKKIKTESQKSRP